MTVVSKPTPNLILEVSETDIFLRNVREKYSSLPKKIQFAIDKFAARKDFENQQILEIQDMYKNKPGEDNNRRRGITRKYYGFYWLFELEIRITF